MLYLVGSKYRRWPGAIEAILFGSLAFSGLPIPRVFGAEPDEPLREIVVTGSRFSSMNASSPSPVVVVDSDELQHQGTTHVEDLLNSLPQVNSGLTLGANGPSVAPLTGTATADLRGIGAFRTLVLIDGKRTAPGDPINPGRDRPPQRRRRSALGFLSPSVVPPRAWPERRDQRPMVVRGQHHSRTGERARDFIQRHLSVASCQRSERG